MDKEEKKKNISFPKMVPKVSRHIRWNWEPSPENEEMVRYHFVVVDDKNWSEKIARVMSYARNKSIISQTFDSVRKNIEGKVKNSGLRYLFETYDSKYPSDFVDPKNVFKNVIQDSQLEERKVLSIEDYVRRTYEK